VLPLGRPLRCAPLHTPLRIWMQVSATAWAIILFTVTGWLLKHALAYLWLIVWCRQQLRRQTWLVFVRNMKYLWHNGRQRVIFSRNMDSFAVRTRIPHWCCLLLGQPHNEWESHISVCWSACHYIQYMIFRSLNTDLQELRSLLPFCVYLFSSNDVESTFRLYSQIQNIILFLYVQVDRM
jgi:hypothetical protein